VPPASLIEPEQRYFDRRISGASSLKEYVYDLDTRRDDNAVYPYGAGAFGTGANFAVDKRLVERIGGFDAALGAGSPTNGGEDLDMFLRVLLSGRAIAYEPSAVIWHIHRSDPEALGRQMYNYGLGLMAYMVKYVLDPATRWEVIKRVPSGARHLIYLWSRSRVGQEGVTRSSAIARYRHAEIRGMIVGPFAYRRARRLERRLPASRPLTQGPTASS
jgi:hypothetical protein